MCFGESKNPRVGSHAWEMQQLRQQRAAELATEKAELKARTDAISARARAFSIPPGPGPADGIKARHHYANGDIAEGIFRGGKLNGRGRFYSNDYNAHGWREGLFRDNKLHGPGGKMTHDNDGRVWVGEFENDELVRGKRYPKEDDYADGYLYDEGDFVLRFSSPYANGVLDRYGPVTRYYKNGDRFVGTMEHPIPSSGEMKEGIYYREGAKPRPQMEDKSPLQQGERFEGRFRDNFPNGSGKFDRNGRSVDGEFKYDGKPFYRLEFKSPEKLREEARREAREQEESNRHWEEERRKYVAGPDTQAKRAKIAAGVSAMQANPGNAWIAGGVGNFGPGGYGG